MKPFDLLNAPLEGVNLIEASAGTGKTYNIEGLFVRLVLEMQLPVEQILVLTFTKAATAELEARIRGRLVQARNAFSGEQCEDALLESLVEQHSRRQEARQRIHETLVDFDQAAIFTIHGFCQRLLHENAFETGNLFDTELIEDPGPLIREVADDFWRRTFYPAPVEFAGFAFKRLKDPRNFYRLLDSVKTPVVNIVPRISEPSLDGLDHFRAALSELKAAWMGCRDEVRRLLMTEALNANIYGSLKAASDSSRPNARQLKVAGLVEMMDRLAHPQSVGFPLFDGFEKFTASKLSAATKKNQPVPEHDFFMICDQVFSRARELQAQMEQYLLYVKTRLFDFAAAELPQRKKERNVQSFDDLLVAVKNALAAPGGHLLAQAVRDKYRAALVDEFQDTDSIQYEILTRLFSHRNGLLFMIGDPKQAIYGFRGADIFSYMKAARQADEKFTLTANWRSRPRLISAVNTIFSRVRPAFVFDEIPFENVHPAPGAAEDPRNPAPPFILWHLEASRFSENKKPLNKPDAVRLISRAVAAEISRLLNASRSTAPGDVAVLVRKNEQAQVIKDHLTAAGIPSVLYSTGNIYDCFEAAEMQTVLAAIADPADSSRLKAALATDMLGHRARDLLDSESESPGLEACRVRFSRYFHLWQHQGFIRMFRCLLDDEQITQRLLSFTDGERRLTNVLHLAEILHRQSIRTNPGISGLVKWLAAQRDGGTARSEETQLRLESDEKAVKIVTIHKSKGLEYRVVFCPFGWEDSLVRGTEITFHDPNADRQLTVDLDPVADSPHVMLAQNELLSENIRLLYVALTRARERCYLAWGRINRTETSALAYLLHGEALEPGENPLAALKTIMAAKSDADIRQDLKRLCDQSANSIQLQPLPVPPDKPSALQTAKEPPARLFCRNFAGKIDQGWKISSYSLLVSRGVRDVDQPDRDFAALSRDAGFTPAPEAHMSSGDTDGESIFAFPGGARSGNFFHDVFEHFDFTTGEGQALERLVTRKLQQHGLALKWRPTVCQTVTNVLSVPLAADLPQLTLSMLHREDRVNEMEFYFPLNPLGPRDLQRLFEQHHPSRKFADFPELLGKLTFMPARGYMKGYMDMVFEHGGRYYLVDWKSNHLGFSPAAYHRSRLQRTMQTEYYILQYHIYALALHLYLKLHQPGYRYENDFGGVFYIFLRGVDASLGPEYGIFYDLPPPAFINALGRTLVADYGKPLNSSFSEKG